MDGSVRVPSKGAAWLWQTSSGPSSHAFFSRLQKDVIAPHGADLLVAKPASTWSSSRFDSSLFTKKTWISVTTTWQLQKWIGSVASERYPSGICRSYSFQGQHRGARFTAQRWNKVRWSIRDVLDASQTSQWVVLLRDMQTKQQPTAAGIETLTYHNVSQHITTYHNVSQRITTYHHVSPRIITYHHVSPRITTYHNVSQRISPRITTYHTISPRITTYHHVPQRITTYHHVSPRITTYHNVSQLITTYHHVSQRITTYINTYHHVSPRITTYHHVSPRITRYHHVSPCITTYITTYHNISPRITTYNHVSPRITTYHHVSQHITTYHHV